MWRPSGHPGLQFMGRSLALRRTYFKFLALQIAAPKRELLGTTKYIVYIVGRQSSRVVS